MALTYFSYQIAKMPHLFSELGKELSMYETIEDINVRELEKLPLLNAVVRECIRMYPPVSSLVPRVCPPQGATIGGYSIPAGVCLTTPAC